MGEPKAKTIEEQLKYWKEMALSYKSDLDSVRIEYSEYQEESRTLENELELDLKQKELKIKDLNSCVIKLMNENELLKSRFDELKRNEAERVGELSTELASLRLQGDELKNYVRQLEQKNDDLERSYRAALVSLDDFEAKLNGAIERNVILESEIDEKEHLKALVQRMRDETRDLRSELRFKPDSNRIVSVPEVQQVPPPPRSSRLTPLSIVNDLLRKVGSLETKLASYSRKEEPSKRHRKNDLIKS